MRTNNVIIICVTVLICILIVCGTLIYLNQSNNKMSNVTSNHSNVTTNNSTTNTSNSSSVSSEPKKDKSDDWFGYVSDPRKNITPHQHADWESKQIDKAESRGFEVTGCNTGGVKNGYDVYSKNGKFAGHID